MTFAGRHRSFYVAVLAGLAGLAVGWPSSPRLALVIATNAFFATYVALSFVSLPRLTAPYLRKHAASSDLPVLIIFIATLAAVANAVVGLFVLLNTEQRPGATEAALTLLAVPLGWIAIHMMAAIHYAHLYWQKGENGEPAGGLDFPATPEPRGIDFVYFSFVIGMTAQTSDVQITSSAMRGINLLHAIVSFFFNTVLVAAAVNAAVTLGN